MPPIKFVTDSFNLWNIVASLLIILVLGAMLRSFVFNAMNVSQTAMKGAYDSLKVACDEQRAEIARLKEHGLRRDEAFQMQEKRIYRVELDAEKKGMRLNYAMEEIRILELAVNISVASLSRISDGGVTHDRVLGLLTSLSETRRKNNDALEDLELTRLSTIAFMEKRDARTSGVKVSTSDTTTTTQKRTTSAEGYSHYDNSSGAEDAA